MGFFYEPRSRDFIKIHYFFQRDRVSIEHYLLEHGADQQLVPQNRPRSLNDIPMFKLYTIPRIKTFYYYLEYRDDDLLNQDDQSDLEEESTEELYISSTSEESENYDTYNSESDSSSSGIYDFEDTFNMPFLFNEAFGVDDPTTLTTIDMLNATNAETRIINQQEQMSDPDSDESDHSVNITI